MGGKKSSRSKTAISHGLLFVSIWKKQRCKQTFDTGLEEMIYLIITQEMLIQQVAESQNQDSAAIRRIFKNAEALIFNILSSTTPSEPAIIKIFDGLSLECRYIPEKTIHTYEELHCNAKIWARPKITRHYNRKLNGYFNN